jgi:hypothetical protein
MSEEKSASEKSSTGTMTKVIAGEEGGFLITQKNYQQYTLHTEYRWGQKTWAPRAEKARMSGIAVHAGSQGLLEVAQKDSYVCMICEGKTGDLGARPGDGKPIAITALVDPKKTKGNPPFVAQYMPWTARGGVKTTFSAPLWLLGLNHDPAFKDVLGFRGKNDWEKPRGEWNTLDIICGPNSITVNLNGRTVNAAAHVSRNKGKVVIGSNQAEIFFRKIDIIPAEK